MNDILVFAAFVSLFVGVPIWWKRRKLERAAQWPTVEGYIAQIEENRDDNGFWKVTLAYTYKVEDKRYVGRETFTFIRDGEAGRFEAGCRQRSVRVHYRPEKPQISVLSREQMG